MFFRGLFFIALGGMLFSSGYFRWRHPGGKPTGSVALSEGLMTGRWSPFSKRRLPPWWMTLPIGIIFIVAGAFAVVVSFL